MIPKLPSASLLLLAAGCGSSSEPAASAETSRPPAGHVWLELSFKQLGGRPASNAEVCLREPLEECVTSGSAGEARFAVPEQGQALVTFVAEGLGPAVHPVTVGTEDLTVTFTEPPLDLVEAAFGSVGAELDWERGLFVVFVEQGGGATGALAPTSGEGPYYLSSLGLPVEGAEAVPEGGGAVAFINVEAGDYEVTLDGAGCEFSEVSWPGSVASSARAPVLAGFGTALRAVCPPE